MRPPAVQGNIETWGNRAMKSEKYAKPNQDLCSSAKNSQHKLNSHTEHPSTNHFILTGNRSTFWEITLICFLAESSMRKSIPLSCLYSRFKATASSRLA